MKDLLMNTAEVEELLAKAEEKEKKARDLLENALEIHECNGLPGTGGCEICGKQAEGLCSGNDQRSEINSLFEQAWSGYRQAEEQARRLACAADSNQSLGILARVLMDIHIHPNSGLLPDTESLWEAQYLWLHLYFRTKEQVFLNQARFCESIRHAKVEKCLQE